MITKTQGYQSSDGKFHPTLESAQKCDLAELLKDEVKNDAPEFYAVIIMKYREKILDILSTTPTSKVRGRKINGATRTRKPKHTAAQNTLPLDTTEPPRAA